MIAVFATVVNIKLFRLKSAKLEALCYYVCKLHTGKMNIGRCHARRQQLLSLAYYSTFEII